MSVRGAPVGLQLRDCLSSTSALSHCATPPKRRITPTKSTQPLATANTPSKDEISASARHFQSPPSQKGATPVASLSVPASKASSPHLAQCHTPVPTTVKTPSKDEISASSKHFESPASEKRVTPVASLSVPASKVVSTSSSGQVLHPALPSTQLAQHSAPAASTPVAISNALPMKRIEQDISDFTMEEPWLTQDALARRRARLGIDKHLLATFCASAEFISLGSYCAVARALQALGIKRLAYPFDWTRTPIEGIGHLLDNNFSDFFACSSSIEVDKVGTVYTTNGWGGSFWHHDPRTQKTQDDFGRRIQRLLGKREDDVKASQTRVFVRALNSTREFRAVLQLYGKLKVALPSARILMLVLVDLQRSPGLIRIAGNTYDGILFYRIDETLFANNGAQWSMEKASEAYSVAIARACSLWAGAPLVNTTIKEYPSLESLMAFCDEYDAGSTSTNMFFPQRVKGQTAALPGPSVQQQPQGSPLPSLTRYIAPIATSISRNNGYRNSTLAPLSDYAPAMVSAF